MIGFALGGVLGLLIASGLSIDAGAAWVLIAICAGLGYLAWCAVFPIKRCWWCKGKEFITDGRGGMRQRPCWRCKRRRMIRRPGARWVGAHGRRE